MVNTLDANNGTIVFVDTSNDLLYSGNVNSDFTSKVVPLNVGTTATRSNIYPMECPTCPRK